MSSDLRPDRAIVTGANGFVGGHVVAELAARGCRVIAVGHQEKAEPGIAERIDEYLCCDVADRDQVRALPLAEVDAVINLAGLAAVGESFAQRELYLQVNAGVIDAICAVALERGLRELRVLAVSSGAVYEGGQDMPLTEESAVDPTSSPYAESKLAMEERAAHYRRAGVDCIVVRPFNHIGPGQGLGFLVPDLLRSIEAARAAGEPMRVGNLTTRRDYTDVRDVAAAYVALAAAPSLEHDLYNVCGGRSRSGSEVLAIILRRMAATDLTQQTDPSRSRPSDNPDIIGDRTRITRAVGWKPTISLEQSIGDYVAGERRI